MGTNRGCSASMKAVTEPFCARWPTSTENGGILWTWRIVPERGDNMTKSKPLITRSEDRAWGATVFAGTRVPVDTLFEYLEAGDTLDEFLRQFPTVERRRASSRTASAWRRST